MITIDYKETGKIEIFYLKKIWNYYNILGLNNKDSEKLKVDWNYINAVFNVLGIGIEPTIQYLFSEFPDFDTFENWILKNGRISKPIINQFNSIVSMNRDAREEVDEESVILSKEDLEHWKNFGFVVIKNAIPKADCIKTTELIYKTIDASPFDKSSWYKYHPLKQGIMVQLFQNDILDKNRLSKRIRKAFEQLWQRSDLLVSMDRVSFNPPETKNFRFPGPDLHWDVSLKKPIPFGLQGLLYLSDTEKNQGAFSVIPGFHNIIESWIEKLPENKNPRDLELLKTFRKETIPGNTGDFVIWNQCLPHGSSPNTSENPRIVQYINYQPIDLKFHEEWV